MTRIAFLLACLVALSACELGGAFVAANVVSIVHTDKTLVDHALSRSKEQDCSLLHAADNEPYCQPAEPVGPREEVAAMAFTHYCYRTLGGVSCYDRPDYAASGQTRVDFAYGISPATAAAPMAALPDLR